MEKLIKAEASLLVFLFILFILEILFLFIITSKIIIKIENLEFKTNKKPYLNNMFNIQIKLVVLKAIPIFSININKLRLQKLKKTNRLKNIKLPKVSLKHINEIRKQIKINIKEFYLNLQIGIEDTVVTTMLIPFISTIIGILLTSKRVKNKNYKILPIYNKRKFHKV